MKKLTTNFTFLAIFFSVCCQFTSINIVYAQDGTNDPTFNPTDLGFGNGDCANYEVETTSIQSDGKIIIGGNFSEYNGTARNRIARLNSDGSLDVTFNPGTGPNYVVRTISIQSDGKIIIGGDFNTYNGITVNKIARLNTDGTLDANFSSGSGTGANLSVFNTIIQSDGKIIVGGQFTTYHGISRHYIARLNTNGTLDATFNAGTGANSIIFSTSIQSDGKIIIGGLFTSFNNIAKNYIARLNTDGTLDTTFNLGTGPNKVVGTTSIQSDGKIIIGGEFTGYNGVVRNRIARLNTDGTLDTTFNPDTGVNGNYVYTTSIQSDGKIIIGGEFTQYNETARNRIARLNTDGSLDTTFNPGTGATNVVRTISNQTDGKIIIGGWFTNFNGTVRPRIARLISDGSLDATFNPGTGVNNPVYTTSIQSDGKIIIGGYFNTYNGIVRNSIARLNSDGNLDTTFNPGTGTNTVIRTSSIQNDGKIIIGGNFTEYNGTIRNHIARINTNGTLDATFNTGTGANGTINNTPIQNDGKIIIGGHFTEYNGIARKGIARLNSDGTLDSTFNPGTGAGGVYTTSIQSDGKIIIGGDFGFYNGIKINSIARLNTDGTLDATFNPGIGASDGLSFTFIYTTSIQSDGKIIIGGDFTKYNGKSIKHLARLNTDGTLDDTFNPYATWANNVIRTTSIQSDGKIIIGGDFTAFNGFEINRIARLKTNGSPDLTFKPGTGANKLVYTTSIQSDGKIIIGGEFTGYNGIGRNRIARIIVAPYITSTTPADRCGEGTLVLGATASEGIVNWYESETDGASLGTGTSFTTPSIATSKTYYVNATAYGITTTSRIAVVATINSSKSTSQNITYCNSADINGKIYTSSQVVVDKLTTNKGCDSTVTTNLTINKSATFAQNIIDCNSAVINGKTYTSSQVVVDKLTAKNGCDSTVTTNLTINAKTTSQNVTATIPTIINGNTYTSSQIVVDIFTASNGCDSTVTTNFTIIPLGCEGPTTFTSTSGTLGYINYPNFSYCEFLIQPTGAKAIILSFTSFSTEAKYDVVQVYDGATTSDPLLGTFSGNSLPSPITSSGGSMLVKFTSDESDTFNGWTASYDTTSPPIITPSCGTTTYTANSDTFGSVNYSDNSDCEFLIQPIGAKAIILTFSTFLTESGYDIVYVYDGATTSAPLLGSYSGSSLPSPVTSSGGIMLVKFTSDESDNFSGWTVSYDTISPPIITPSCSGSTSYIATSGTFSSVNYSNNSDCEFLIQPLEAKAIRLSFSSFSTESGYDYVYIYDGATTFAPLLGTFSGNSLPSPVTSSGGTMLVKFTSDGSQTYTGWTAIYDTTKAPCNKTTLQNITTTNPAIINGNTYITSQTVVDTLIASNGCDSTVTTYLTINDGCSGSTTYLATSGTFGSVNYSDNSDCEFLIQPIGAKAIILTFSSFLTESSYDIVYVYDGSTTSTPLLGSYSGSSLPSPVSSSGGTMLVKFTSDGSQTYTGWTAIYDTIKAPCNKTTLQNITTTNPAIINGNTYITSQTVVDTLIASNGCDSTVTTNLTIVNGCSGSSTYLASSGSLSSVNYSNNSDCEFLIQPTGANAIKLTFATFSTESGYDFVKVYDGLTTAAPLLGNFSGNSLPLPITSSSGTMLVKFTSDGSSTSTGWSASYDTTSISCIPDFMYNKLFFCDSAIVNGKKFKSSQTIVDSLKTSAGCDSIVTTFLTINQTKTTNQNVTACGFVVINGINYTTSQTVVDVLQASNGCDSTVTTNLTIHPIIPVSVIIISNATTICSGQSVTVTATSSNGGTAPSYQWKKNGVNVGTNSATYTSTSLANGDVISCVMTSNATCVSPTTATSNVIMMNINLPKSTTQNITTCNSADINGKTYSSSQIVIDKLIAKNGCDSTVTTNLTINKSVTFSQNITTCNSAVINGKTYTSSQVVVDKLTAKNGCDSTITTNLTINTDVNKTQDITVVKLAVINGNTYTTSQIVIDMLKAKNGCDSIVTTNLTITLTTALEELNPILSNIKVYPNPFSNNLNLEYSLDEVSDVTIQLVSILGNKVYESVNKEQSIGNHKLNITAQTSGIYSLTLTVNNKRFATRVVKID